MSELTYLLFASAILSASLIVLAWSQRKAPGAKPFLLTMAMWTIWSSTAALELFGDTLEWKVFWRNAQQISTFLLPPTGMYLIFDFFNRGKELARKVFRLLVTIPIIGILLIWSNSFHHLMRSKVELVESAVGMVLYIERAPLNNVFILYNMVLLFITIVFAVYFLIKSPRLYRLPGYFILFSFLLPFILVNLRLTKFFFLTLPPTPVMFIPASIILFLSIFKFQLFTVIPNARNLIFEQMNQGFIIMDVLWRVADVNPVGKTFLKEMLNRDVEMGVSIKEQFDGDKELLHTITSLQRNIGHEMVGTRIGNKIYDIRTSPLTNRNVRLGYLTVVTDVTERFNYEDELLKRATLDPLTKIYNRRAIIERSSALLEEHQEATGTIGMAIIDIDYFKTINDTYGHLIGDRVIRELALLIKASSCEGDIFGRVGGEEFIFIMPNTSLGNVLQRMEAFRLTVEEHVMSSQSLFIKFTVSIGVAMNAEGDDFDTLFAKADRALYEVKHSTRNGVGM